MRETKRNIFINILTVFFTILACFIIAEITLRFISYDYKKSPGPGSSYTIETREYKMPVMMNSLNMRDYEIHPKEKNEFRILCLGDSFTFGLGVDIEDAYPKVLERILNKGRGKFYVLNGGGSSFVGGCYDFLIKKGLELKPDLVIVQIFIGNDFYNARQYLRPEIISPERKDEGLLLKLKQLLSTKCYTADFIWSRLVQIEYMNDLLFHFHLRYSNRGIFLREYPELEKQLAKVVLEYLEKINNLCNNKEIKVIFIVVPSKAQVFKGYLLNNKRYYYKKPDEIIKTFCRSHSIVCIDFLDNYEKLSRREVESFYYIIDSHWTAQGHKYAAEVLTNLIKDELNFN